MHEDIDMTHNKQITINDVKFFNTRTMVEPDGNLVPIESNQDVPFHIKRVFYVYGVKNQNDRGKHSHYETKQLLICLSFTSGFNNFQYG